MNLMMFLGNDLIEAIPLDKENIPVPGYLGNFKRYLKNKYRDSDSAIPGSAGFFCDRSTGTKESQWTFQGLTFIFVSLFIASAHGYRTSGIIVTASLVHSGPKIIRIA